MYYNKGRATLYRSIGEQIMLARRRAGLTQRETAERVGISHASYQNIEVAKSRPNLDNLAEIADVLGVPLKQLVNLDEPPQAVPQPVATSGSSSVGHSTVGKPQKRLVS